MFWEAVRTMAHLFIVIARITTAYYWSQMEFIWKCLAEELGKTLQQSCEYHCSSKVKSNYTQVAHEKDNFSETYMWYNHPAKSL